jgi:phosphoribosylformylglycinamidine cyclo-ligase
MDYRESGVDIDRGDAWVETIKKLVSRRKNLPPAGIGGFSGVMSAGGGRSIAACCDGVGTKLELAKATGIYRGLGQDLVAMSVNDLATCGASPLFFLDYIACGALDETKMATVMEGILDACEESRCALLGGETAERPGVYPADGFDLAGFAVGLVDDEKIIDGSKITEGDAIIGLESSGLHSNGYSLVRKALAARGGEAILGEKTPESATIGETVMRPTRIYVRQALAAIETGLVKGMAHITGGGAEANINRVIPAGLKCELDYGSWKRGWIFDFIKETGVDEAEMRRVFNLGIGFAFVAGERDAETLSGVLRNAGENPRAIGRVVRI